MKIRTEQKRLQLTRETLQQLEQSQLEQAAGGVEISGSYPFCAK